MLMGKLYAILFYGVDEAEGRRVAFHWTMLMNMAVVAWVIFSLASLDDAFKHPGFKTIALAVGITASLPVLVILIRGLCRNIVKWEREQAESESAAPSYGNVKRPAPRPVTNIPAKAPAMTTPAKDADSGKQKVYDVDRSGERLVCPACGREQKADRKTCFQCGVRFSE